MKRETRRDLKIRASTGTNPDAMAAQDALDSDARQRAEIRRLRAALGRIVKMSTAVGRGWLPMSSNQVIREMRDQAAVALKPLKKGRKS